MVKTMNEIEKIFTHIEKKENFLLSGGAGSGKTYTLVEVLKKIYAKKPSAKVACITYTNVAVNEIKGRVPFENLYVSTIHSFLWDNIVQYQKNLKEALAKLVENKEIRYYKDEQLSINNIEKIQYQEWKDLEKGIISHGEVITLAKYMVEKNKLLARILTDKYDYIFIDEYQDTSKEVIELFLTHLYPYSKKCIIGLFGDSMQAIYDEGLGDVKKFIEEEKIKEVSKEDNRRNPQIIIDLANELRLDDIKQKHANDKDAPNYGVNGKVTLLHLKDKNFFCRKIIINTIVAQIKKPKFDMKKLKFDRYNVQKLMAYKLGMNDISINTIKEKYFNFPIIIHKDGSKSTNKELYLTHNLIAPKVGFPTLMAIYDKDRILKHRDDINKNLKDNEEEIDENKTFEEVLALYPIKEGSEKWKYLNNNKAIFDIVKNWTFKDLNKIRIDKDNLVKGKKNDSEDEKTNSKKDALIQHLFDIQECIHFYTKNRHNEFIKKTNFWESIKKEESDKKSIKLVHLMALKNNIDDLINTKDKTIGEVIDLFDNKNIWKKKDKFKEFTTANEYYEHIYEKVRKVSYQELVNLYNYVEGYTIYSTQHNIKGDEFDNVFIVLDNGNWSNYNFKYLFEKSLLEFEKDLEEEKQKAKINKKKVEEAESRINVLKRTQKIFYVCCTRTKENLVVLYLNPSDDVLKRAKKWFDSNVQEI